MFIPVGLMTVNLTERPVMWTLGSVTVSSTMKVKISASPGFLAACRRVTWGGGDIKQMTQLKSLTRQKQLEVRRVWCYLRGAGGLCNDADGLGQLALGDFYSQTSWSLSQVSVQLSVWRWYPAAQLSVITPSPTIERRWVCNHEVHLKRKKEGVTH